MNYAIVENGTVVNVIWLSPRNASEFENAVWLENRPVAIGDSYTDGKCPEYIEGYRFVLAGETRTRADGVEFSGEMVAPFIDSKVLEAAQGEYERELLAEALADRDAAVYEDKLMLKLGKRTYIEQKLHELGIG